LLEAKLQSTKLFACFPVTDYRFYIIILTLKLLGAALYYDYMLKQLLVLLGCFVFYLLQQMLVIPDLEMHFLPAANCQRFLLASIK
jgi:hypothetical protein